MKKVLFFLFIVLVSVQCRKDDDKPATVTEPNLQGRWYVVSHSVIDDRTGTPELAETQYTDCEKKTYIEYLDTGKSVSVRYRETFSECILDSEGSSNYTWDKTANTIKHNYTNNSVFEYNIVKLTDKELVTKFYFLSDSGGVFHTVYELKTYKRN
ncbi:lipocalin family protein [Epilithonimonas sp.]|uniref:lipocalin family protein n=1 Tax=Epilithonimonas sp. TaxID=2894511 RepID=UPI002FDE145C